MMMFNRLASIAMVAACVVATAAQQPARDVPSQSPASRSGVVRGRVTLKDTGAPLAAALVAPTSNPLGGVTTDEEGRYEIAGLPPGKVTLRVAKLGYVPASYSFRLPADQLLEVELTPGQVLTGIDFVMTNGGVIVARVLNQRGEPASGVAVMAIRFKYSGGGMRELSARAVTNDVGEARIYGLPPGEYYLALPGQSSTTSDPGYGYGYYPGTALFSQAQTVSVTAGQETEVLMSPSPGSRLADISVTIRGVDGLPFPQLPFIVTSFPQGSGQHTHIANRRAPDGTLTIGRLPPGQYLVQVRPTAELSADEMQYIWLPFEVNGEALSLTVNGTRGGAMLGRVVSDTGEPLTGISPASIKLALTAPTYAENERQPEVKVRSDWSFAADSVINSRVLRVEPASGWYLEAVIFEGRDIADVPIDFTNGARVEDVRLVLTRRPSSVSGSIDQMATPRHAVLVYSDDPAQWTLDSRRITLGRVDASGRFNVRGLPPGKYLAVAVNDLDSGEERDPSLLQRLRNQAVGFTLSESEAVALNLRTAK